MAWHDLTPKQWKVLVFLTGIGYGATISNADILQLGYRRNTFIALERRGYAVVTENGYQVTALGRKKCATAPASAREQE